MPPELGCSHARELNDLLQALLSIHRYLHMFLSIALTVKTARFLLRELEMTALSFLEKR